MDRPYPATPPLTPAMMALVETQRLGFVATVCENGEPNVSPKGTFVVVDDRTLAFGDVRSPGTSANIRRGSAVEINFVDPLTRKGFRAKGEAIVHAKGCEAYREHHARFDRWPTLANRIEHIVLIVVQSAKPLTSPVYDDGAVETELRAQWLAVLTAERT